MAAWRHGGGVAAAGGRRRRGRGGMAAAARGEGGVQARGRRPQLAAGKAQAVRPRRRSCEAALAAGGERFKRKRYRTGETSPRMRSVGGRQGWAQRAGRAGRARVRGECCLVVPRAGDEKVGVRRPVEAGYAVGGGVLDLDVVVGVVACAGAERHSAGSDRSSARQPVCAARLHAIFNYTLLHAIFNKKNSTAQEVISATVYFLFFLFFFTEEELLYFTSLK